MDPIHHAGHGSRVAVTNLYTIGPRCYATSVWNLRLCHKILLYDLIMFEVTDASPISYEKTRSPATSLVLAWLLCTVYCLSLLLTVPDLFLISKK